ncbi:MAG: methyltransferase domain-containing protein [Dehalococcoidales bacterium]|nr:methyltransferase domain-containing protein [Dehalococcoidales bacterium]
MSRDFFNSRAATWDDEVAEKDASRLEAMAERLDIRLGASVLDIGTGTGVFVPFLLNKIGSEGKLVCLDFAEEMLKIAKTKGFKGKISYLCTDIENNRLADNSFDAVVCYSVFPHFNDKVKAFKEIYRLLKKGGNLFICHTSSRQAINEVHQSIPEVCNHLFPENEDTRRMLSEVGFEDIIINDGKDNYMVIARKLVVVV